MCIVAAAAIVGVGAIASSAISSNAATSAANTQAGAAENAQQISQNEFNTITGQEQPFMQAGYGALSALNYGLGVGGSAPQSVTTPTLNGYDPSSGYRINPSGGISRLLAGGGATSTVGTSGTATPGGSGLGYGSLIAPFTADYMKQYSPAYQFQLQQGQQGTLNAEAASNGALSGSAQKDLMSFNQNLANTSFNNAFNQYQTQQGNIYSRLAGIAQLGQNAASNTGQQGTALAGQAAQSAQNIGTAQAAGQIGSANAITGGINSLSALPWLFDSGGGGSSGAMATDALAGAGS
jgi:hypothetical protein